MFEKFKSMLNMSDKSKPPVGGGYQANKSLSFNYRSNPYHGSLTWDWAKGMAFDNTYPSVSKIANAFMEIRPYAIDQNGKPLEKMPAVDKLYHPNQQMSSVDFRQALAVSALSHRTTYILVWHRGENGEAVAGGGGVTPDNIAGYTFLEDCCVKVVDGHKYYKSPSLKFEFSDREVIEISAGIDPNDLTAGYSPTQAVKKWANIDDYIASYEGGLFENDAVPSGQFVIVAPTVEAFNEIVDEMQAKHRGSGNNNNVQYIHRPISADTGAVSPAQIEWIPFSQSNKDMSLETIFKQVNDKIDSTFGVPASIRGVNDNNTYASVKVDERIFVRWTLKPFATKIWTRFTHELNRITGGLGYAITFDVEIPSIADEEKVDAERKKVEADIITQMLDRGYSLDSIVDAFEFSNAYKLLEMGADEGAEIENDKPDVDTGEEVEDSPEEAVTKSVCHHHDEIHKEADKNTLKELRRLLNDYLETSIDETVASLQSASKAISAIGLEIYDENGDGVIDEQEVAQIPIPQPSEERKYALQVALLALLYARMLKSGEKRYQDTIAQFSIALNVPALEHYVISDGAEKQYEAIVNKIVNSFTDQITDTIKGAIDLTVQQGGSKSDLVKNIKNVFETDQWRVERIVNTEEHRADNFGQIDAVDVLQKVTGREFGFKWRTTSGHPCEFCQYMNGTVVATGEAFIPLGEKIELDNSVYLNNYEDILTPQAHPNCQCVFDVVEL